MLRENTVTATLCFLELSSSEWVQNSPVFEFQNRYIEHHFDVYVAAFLFCFFKNDFAEKHKKFPIK